MGLFNKKKQQETADFNDRRRAGLQTAWRDTGIDPKHLSYEETPGTDRAVVRDTRTGNVVSRQRHS